MNDEQKRLYIRLVQAGKVQQAQALLSAYQPPMGRRTSKIDLGERGELVARAKQLGMDSSDLFVPEEPWKNKFTADMGAFFTRQGLGINQAYQHMQGGDTQNIDQRVADAEQEYRDTGLADEFTGGQLVGGLSEGFGGGFLARKALAAAPYITGSVLGAAEMAPEPVIGADGGAVRGMEYASGKAGQLAIGATLGTLGEGIPKGAAMVGESVLNAPGSAYRTLLKPSSKKAGGVFRGSADDIDEVIRLRNKSGIDFTPGQITGSGAVKQAEELARTNIFTRDRVAISDMSRIDQLNNYIKSFRDSLGEAAPIEVIAPKMQAFGRDTVGKMKTARRKQASKDYGVITRANNGQPFIPADNYRDVLESIIKQGEGTGAGPAQRSAASEAKSRLSRLKKQGGMLRGQDVDNLTRAEGFVGGDNPFNKTKPDTRAASMIRDAVESDVSVIPDLAEQLKIAKSNYKKGSDTINEFEVNLLGQIIGKEFASDITGLLSETVSPEKVFSRFTNTSTSPTEIRAAFSHLDKANPELSNQFRASIVERARQASKVKPASAGAPTGAIDPGTFLRNLGVSGGERGLKGLERLAAIFPNNTEFLNDVRRAATILADKSLMNTSKTAVTAAAQEAVEASTNILMGSFKKLANLMGGLGSMQYIARRMENPRMVDNVLRFTPYREAVDALRPVTVPALIEVGRDNTP